MTVHDIPDSRTLALLHAGCRTRLDLAAELGVLSSSRFLDESIVRLQKAGLVTVTADGEPAPTYEQPALDTDQPCPTCRLKRWDAADVQPGDLVCTCNDPFDEEI